ISLFPPLVPPQAPCTGGESIWDRYYVELEGPYLEISSQFGHDSGPTDCRSDLRATSGLRGFSGEYKAGVEAFRLPLFNVRQESPSQCPSCADVAAARGWPSYYCESSATPTGVCGVQGVPTQDCPLCCLNPY